MIRETKYEDSLHALKVFLHNIPSTFTAPQEVALECVNASNLDDRPSEPLQLEELVLRLVSQSRLHCFTIEFPDEATQSRWQRTLQRQFPRLHAKDILQFKYTGESDGGDYSRRKSVLVS